MFQRERYETNLGKIVEDDAQQQELLWLLQRAYQDGVTDGVGQSTRAHLTAQLVAGYAPTTVADAVKMTDEILEACRV